MILISQNIVSPYYDKIKTGTLIVFIFLLGAMTSCISDEALREDQIRAALELKFGPNVNCEIQSQEYTDSLLSYPSDSICLQSALKTLECYDVYENNIDTYRKELLVLLNRTDGEITISLDTLPNNLQTSYKEMINSMRLVLRQFHDTYNTIQNFNPHSLTREVITFKVANNNDTIAYWGVFYFQENKMTNYIVMEKSKANEVYAVIDYSINKDNTFISRPLSKLGFNINNESVALLSEQREPPLFLWDLQAAEPNKKNLSNNNSQKPLKHSSEIPKFSIIKREREDFDKYTPRTRFHVRIPKSYSESQLDLIADSLRNKEMSENKISEIWVNYYLPNKKIHYSNSYGLSIRLRTERSSTISIKENKKTGYNPPQARDLSGETPRGRQINGAFDRGRITGYEDGYKDGKRNKLYRHYHSDYPSSDDWIKQSYIQGYEIGYLEGYDDAGGNR